MQLDIVFLDVGQYIVDGPVVDRQPVPGHAWAAGLASALDAEFWDRFPGCQFGAEVALVGSVALDRDNLVGVGDVLSPLKRGSFQGYAVPNGIR